VTAWRQELFDERALRIPVEELSNWPLYNYLWAAILQAEYLDKDRGSIEENWQTPAWDFGRFAKAHPELINLDENQALKRIKSTISSKVWSDHLQMSSVDAEMAFDHVWVDCRAIPGYDPLRIAILEARRNSKADDPNAPAGYTMFVDIARSLQRLVGGGAHFLLPCHKLAPLLNCQPMTVSRYRRKAIRDGYLKVVKDHSYRSANKGEATEFLFEG
jgi:hypothetical protein